MTRDGNRQNGSGGGANAFTTSNLLTGLLQGSDHRVLYVLTDLLLSLGTGTLALFLWNLSGERPVTAGWYLERLYWFPLFTAGTLASFSLSGLYMITSPDSYRASFYRILRGLAGLLVLYYTIYFFAPRNALPRLVVLYYVVLSVPVFAGSRRLLWWAIRQPELQEDLILVGNPSDATRLRPLLDDRSLTGLRITGVYPAGGMNEDSDAQYETPEGKVRSLDRDKSLLRYARRLKAAGVVIFHERYGFSDEMLNQLVDCYRKGIPITSGLELIEELSGRFPLSYAREHPGRLFPARRDDGMFYHVLKRTTDVLGGLTGLLLFAPLFPLLAAGIKLTSEGPVFFRQDRTGQYGEPFQLVKLRTMVENAEEETGAQWARKNDPRITSFGKFLRLTHLDEFPQFWNVLKGDMSLVGPRPERPEIEEELADPNPFFKLRHSVRPGVTGWATIKNQYVDSLEKAERRLEYDLYYIEHQSIWLDLHILFETAWELVTLGGR